MQAPDLHPSRLEQARRAVRELIPTLSGDRIGLVAFAGGAFTAAPLTTDYGGVLLALESLDTATIPRRGTSLAAAVDEAVRGFRGIREGSRILILISDGEDHEGATAAALERARQAGIRIFAIGTGTPDGELMPLPGGSFLKDRQGNVVKTRLNEDNLRQLADATGGVYLRATAEDFGLRRLYRERLTTLERREAAGRQRPRYQERFQIPLALAVVLLVADPFVRQRRRQP